MYKDIFKKKKRLPGQFRALLIAFLGAIVIILFIQVTLILWRRPIVIVRISEFSLNAGTQKIMPGEQMKNPDFSVITPRLHGSLNIRIQNIGRSPAQDITLSFLPRYCKLGKLYIKKSDTDCVLEVTPPTRLQLKPDLGPERAKLEDGGGYYIRVKELRPGSQVQLKYAIYREGAQEPIFKFGKMSSSNAKVKAFYYRQ
jgi:hypothetical protein